jgi:Flp pilus assembly protein TadG
MSLRSRSSRDRGQSAAELAVFLPVLLVILYAVIQFGQLYLQYQEVSAATSEGARRASTMAGIAEPGRTSTITSTVRGGTSVGATTTFDTTGLVVSVSSTWTPGSPVTITSTYPAKVTILGVTLYSGSLTTKRTVRVLS